MALLIQRLWIHLASKLGFRKEDRHTPTPKSALMFSWIGTTKRSFALYVCREQQKQTLRRFMKFYPVGNVIY